MLKEYFTIKEVFGPLVLVGQVSGASYEELVELELPDGQIRRGRVLELSGETAFCQIPAGNA